MYPLAKKLYSLLVYVISVIGFISCTKHKEDIKKYSPPPERPAQKSRDVILMYSDSTKLKALLKAKEMISYEKNQKDPFVFFPQSIEIIFYNPQSTPTSTLTAQQAVYFTQTQKAYLKYNIHFINDKKEHLITEDVVWDQKSGKIFSDKPVKIITPTQIINGNGIECEEDFSDYTIKNITGIIQINDSTTTP